jgi:hypothetical protein
MMDGDNKRGETPMAKQKDAQLNKNSQTLLKLWEAYPWPPEVKYSSGGYSNECAIRMSIAIEGAAKAFFKNYTEPKSPEGWARGAESLAVFLWKHHLGRPKIFKSTKSFREASMSAAGIVFYKDCFVRAGEKHKRGDHIDLWYNGTTMGFNDPNGDAEQVWFWSFY